MLVKGATDNESIYGDKKTILTQRRRFHIMFYVGIGFIIIILSAVAIVTADGSPQGGDEAFIIALTS